jgi:hypothetical protein
MTSQEYGFPTIAKKPIAGVERDDYWTTLSVEWGVREWWGLALCLATLIVTTILNAISIQSHLQYGDQGCMFPHTVRLTGEGVTEVLQVG